MNCPRRGKGGHPAELTLVLEGPATFLRLPKLAPERVPSGIILHINLTGLSYIDPACLGLTNWEKQHEATGGKLVLDWKTLRARSHQERPRLRTTK